MFTPLRPHAPRSKRRPLIVGTSLVLLVGAAVFLVLHARTPDAHSPTPSATPTPTPTAPRAGRATVDLSGMRWTNFHGIRLPSSPRNGPRLQQRGQARGFSHTPGGALFAAVHLAVRANAQWGPQIFTPTIRHQVVGPDRSALLAQTRAYYARLAAKAHVEPGGPIGRAYAAQEAFAMQQYTPSSATVDLVTAGPAGDGTTARAATRVQVVWRDGDWRVLAPPGGDWGNTARAVSSLDDYTRFRE